MAASHGKRARFSLDNNSGSLTDISAYLDMLGLPRTADMAEVTTYGKNAKVYIVGLTDGTISGGGPYDEDLDDILAPLLGREASLSYQFDPAGTASGRPRYAGECFVNSYDVQAPVGDKGTISFGIQCSDTITRSTQ